jgi:hypothetical protein
MVCLHTEDNGSRLLLIQYRQDSDDFICYYYFLFSEDKMYVSGIQAVTILVMVGKRSNDNLVVGRKTLLRIVVHTTEQTSTSRSPQYVVGFRF